MDATLLQGLITGIHIRSNYGPDIDMDAPFTSGSTDPATQTLLKALQPQITIDSAAGPLVIHPWGDPGPTQWGDVLAGLGLGGTFLVGFALYGAYKLVFR